MYDIFVERTWSLRAKITYHLRMQKSRLVTQLNNHKVEMLQALTSKYKAQRLILIFPVFYQGK